MYVFFNVIPSYTAIITLVGKIVIDLFQYLVEKRIELICRLTFSLH